MKVYLDPAAEGITEKHLRAFESGKYGPIWATASSAAPSNPISYTTAVATIPATYNYPAIPSAVPRSLQVPGTGPSSFAVQTPLSYNYPPVPKESCTSGTSSKMGNDEEDDLYGSGDGN